MMLTRILYARRLLSALLVAAMASSAHSADPPSSQVMLVSPQPNEPTLQAPTTTNAAVQVGTIPMNGDTTPSPGDMPQPPSPELGGPTQGAMPAVPSLGIPAMEVASVNLASVLELAGVQNPDLLIARQRVVEAAAVRQFAAAQLLPNLNGGMNYDDHTGALQQSSGNILGLQRQALYVGAGANAVAAGTVNIPGIQYNLNVSQSIYGFLAARQAMRTQELDTQATRNDVFLRVATAYVELLRAECVRAIAIQIRDEAAEVARLTANYASTGEGRRSDADRAATEYSRREADILQAEGDVLLASARLSQLLNLDPSIRLHSADGWVVPSPIVPDPIPMSELITIALLRRPELEARRSSIQEALINLRGARILPFSPQVMLGFSAGGFGGGSNKQNLGVPSSFSPLAARTDTDVVMYWTLQNMGFGNRAMIETMRARVGISNYRALAELDQVRFDVASAYARIHSRFAQLSVAEQAVHSGSLAFSEDLNRIRAREGLPIEVL
ncbi:MAG TPA: TolC family protein, partial [Pirellulales bacterium]|nr:TolC family protein [Pirellulales bacterium]